MAMWTDERAALLRKMWAEGLSAAQIARQIGGVTRNACIGKVHRLGLAGRTTPSQPPKRLVRSQRPRSTSPRINRVEQAAQLSAELARIAALPPLDPKLSIERLNALTCHYPIGDPKDADFAYCGRTCSKGVWCAEHRRLVYRPDSVQSMKRTESAAGWAARKDQGGQYIAGFGV